MCGIAGFISDNPRYDGNAIVRGMLERLGHRGPDQAGCRQYGSCTIGMVRLSIIDAAEHVIPIEADDGRSAIVYNGEIYNYREIKARVGDAFVFRTKSDGEAALLGYCREGTDVFNRFNGMYAFAIWDGIRDELVIVRDKTGEKPLYYCQGKDYFAFASEMKALFEIVEPECNEAALSYQAFEFTCGRETLFKNIYCLEPGDYGRFRRGSLSIHSYWKIWDNRIDVPADYRKIKKDLTELLHSSILLRTENCAHGYGVLVSGGIDSALVACITKPDHIFTCHYGLGEEFDELNYAQLVAARIGRKLEIIEPGPDDFRRTEERIAYHLDTPCSWTSFSWWMLLETLSKHVKVILTGDGADEIFGGYHRYLLLYNDEQIRKLDAMKQYAFLIDRYYGSFVDRYSRLINRCDNRSDRRVQEYLDDLIGSFHARTGEDVIHSMGVTDFYTTMQVLLQMADRMCMAFSVENRSPFLDYRLIQYAFSMPPEFKIRDGITKWLLKDIARDFIPKEIVERVDKRGFSAPINRWFGLEQYGKYDRRSYRKMSFDVWQRLFLTDEESAGRRQRCSAG